MLKQVCAKDQDLLELNINQRTGEDGTPLAHLGVQGTEEEGDKGAGRGGGTEWGERE